jgi:hypothetical protein
MAQQNQKKSDRKFEKPNVPSKVVLVDHKPLKVAYSATIVDPLSKELVDGQEVTVTVNGKNATVVISADGKIAGDVDIHHPGEYVLEMEMLDTNGDRVSPNVSKKIIAEAEKHEEHHRDLHLFVHKQRQEKGYRIFAEIFDDHGTAVADHDVEVHIAHPDGNDYPFKTHHGSGSFLIPFAKEGRPAITVTGVGPSRNLFIGTKKEI